MEARLGMCALLGSRSEALVGEIMKTIRLDQADATAMALRMLIAELIIAADMLVPALGETQGAA